MADLKKMTNDLLEIQHQILHPYSITISAHHCPVCNELEITFYKYENDELIELCSMHCSDKSEHDEQVRFKDAVMNQVKDCFGRNIKDETVLQILRKLRDW